MPRGEALKPYNKFSMMASKVGGVDKLLNGIAMTNYNKGIHAERKKIPAYIAISILMFEGSRILVNKIIEKEGQKEEEFSMKAIQEFDKCKKEFTKMDADFIIEAVAKYYGISVDDMISIKRDPVYLKPRQVSMYLCNEIISMSIDELAERYGNRDHVTIIHAAQKIKNDIKENEDLQNEISEIKHLIVAERI